MIPRSTTRAVLIEELEVASRWCERRSWRLDFDSDALDVDVWLVHLANKLPIRLSGQLTDYREVPPAWRVLGVESGEVSPATFPAPGTVFGQGSIFHPNLLLCAPWNRLAYSSMGGIHGDWGEPARWLNVTGPAIARATTVVEMLSVFSVHLGFSPGFMA